MTIRICSGLLLIVSAVPVGNAQLPQAHSGDWPRWRGPNGNGVAESGQQPPVTWSETENVAWKAPVPGRGHSSPTVAGERVFLTTADDTEQVQSVLCFDRRTGGQIWKRDVNRGSFPARIHHKNTHATPSVACDGTRLYAAFLNHDAIQVVALDLEGMPVWEHFTDGFTPQEYRNGYGASPLLYGNLVIVVGDFDGNAFMVALDRESGQRIWHTPRPSHVNYPSPVVADVAGRHQLLLSGGYMVAGYDPRSGTQQWKATATTMATAGTMIWEGDLVFASGGFPDPGTFCIRADGSGSVVWQNNHKCYEQSMIAADGFVYAINDTGIALCWDAATGTEQWRHRLRGPISASPVHAGQQIYASNELGTTWVYRATPGDFELIGRNQLGTEVFSSPAICGGRIYLRVADSNEGQHQETLYCIAESAAK